MESSVEESKPHHYKDTDQILNFRDAVIYGSDLRLLQRRTEWLNDSCIHFYFTWLQSKQKEEASPTETLFLDPSVLSFFVHQCVDEEDIEDFANSTCFSRHGRIFFPINDNMEMSSNWQIPNGGNHWSLLVAIVNNDNVTFWHFDSIKNSGNQRAAQDIVQKLMAHSRLFFRGETTAATPVPYHYTLIPAKTPIQQNGYDCGVHMLAAAKLFSSVSVTEKDQHLEIYEKVLQKHVQNNPDFCQILRFEIAHEILRLAKAKKNTK